MMKRSHFECGKVCAAHGVRGLFKTEVWCDSPKVLAAQKRVFLAEKDGSFTERKITSATVASPGVILGIEGVDTREAAFALRGTILYLAREDIPLAPGCFLLADLIGLPVLDVDTGRVYGEITAIDDAPASRLCTVKTAHGDVILPFIPEFFKEIDPQTCVRIRPIPGFFNDSEI